MSVHILPSGKSVTLRPPEEVSERLRKPVGRALLRVRDEVEAIRRQIPPLNERVEELKKAGDDPEALAFARKKLEAKGREFAAAATDEELDAYDRQNDLAAVAMVARWDYPEPVTLDAVMDLPHADYDALRAIVAPSAGRLFLDTEPDPKDPNSTAPGGGSPDSAPLSPEGPLTTSLTSSEPTSSFRSD